MRLTWQTLSVLPTTKISNQGSAVSGFDVVFKIVELEEQHTVFVATIDPETVKIAINKFVLQRKKLVTLTDTLDDESEDD